MKETMLCKVEVWVNNNCLHTDIIIFIQTTTKCHKISPCNLAQVCYFTSSNSGYFETINSVTTFLLVSKGLSISETITHNVPKRVNSFSTVTPEMCTLSTWIVDAKRGICSTGI